MFTRNSITKIKDNIDHTIKLNSILYLISPRCIFKVDKVPSFVYRFHLLSRGQLKHLSFIYMFCPTSWSWLGQSHIPWILILIKFTCLGLFSNVTQSLFSNKQSHMQNFKNKDRKVFYEKLIRLMRLHVPENKSSTQSSGFRNNLTNRLNRIDLLYHKNK